MLRVDVTVVYCFGAKGGADNLMVESLSAHIRQSRPVKVRFWPWLSGTSPKLRGELPSAFSLEDFDRVLSVSWYYFRNKFRGVGKPEVEVNCQLCGKRVEEGHRHSRIF